jgi:hypothetical protein
MTLRGGDWGIFYTRRRRHNLPRPPSEEWSSEATAETIRWRSSSPRHGGAT